jgi:hypothetical protein
VVASDGFHTSQDDSQASFTTPGNPPLAGIGAPLDGGQGFLPLFLTGAGYDLEDGELPDQALAWASDLDGPLGSGRNLLLESLSIGLHHLTLTVTDSQGHSAQHTLAYTVLERPLVFLPLIRR